MYGIGNDDVYFANTEGQVRRTPRALEVGQIAKSSLVDQYAWIEEALSLAHCGVKVVHRGCFDSGVIAVFRCSRKKNTNIELQRSLGLVTS